MLVMIQFIGLAFYHSLVPHFSKLVNESRFFVFAPQIMHFSDNGTSDIYFSICCRDPLSDSCSFINRPERRNKKELKVVATSDHGD